MADKNDSIQAEKTVYEEIADALLNEHLFNGPSRTAREALIEAGKRAASVALARAAREWSEDPDSWGDSTADFRNRLRDLSDEALA